MKKNETSKQYNESINEKEQDGSQGEEPFQMQHQQQQDFKGIYEILHETIDVY